MEEEFTRFFALLCVILFQSHDLAESIQCYSCKAHSSNEVDANIRCLEKAHLENCDDFYDYYNEVEDQSVLSYEYYYYEQEAAEIESEADDVKKVPTPSGGQKRRPSKREKRQAPRRLGPGSFRNSEEDSRREEFERRQGPRRNGPSFEERDEERRVIEISERRQPPPRRSGPGPMNVEPPPRRSGPGPVNVDPEAGRREVAEFDRRQIPNRPSPTFPASNPKEDERKPNDSDARRRDNNDNDNDDDDDDDKRGDNDDDADDEDTDGNDDDGDDDNNKDDVEYEYYDDYEYVDYEYPATNPPTTTTTDVAVKTTALATTAKGPKAKPTLPRDPEHYCYSATKKDDWESYTVEKGCKKIRFCEEHIERLPEWGHPWNFCCDKSRCNAKQVKDKPQRIFGMKCRRTDDCIQGHNSRPVCPSHFKSCPRISSSMIKMECRVKDRTMDSVKNTARYQNAFKEKKCYCRKGSFPRGPICTSASGQLFTWSYIMTALWIPITMTMPLFA